MNQKDTEQLKLEILKECQRQMLLKGFSVLDVYEIGKSIRTKFNIKFEDKTKEQIIEDARRDLC